MSYIFISYSRKDLGLAEVLVEGLKKNGFEIWIDWNSIPKGEQLSSEITQGIEKCAAFIFLIRASILLPLPEISTASLSFFFLENNGI